MAGLATRVTHIGDARHRSPIFAGSGHLERVTQPKVARPRTHLLLRHTTDDTQTPCAQEPSLPAGPWQFVAQNRCAQPAPLSSGHYRSVTHRRNAAHPFGQAVQGVSATHTNCAGLAPRFESDGPHELCHPHPHRLSLSPIMPPGQGATVSHHPSARRHPFDRWATFGTTPMSEVPDAQLFCCEAIDGMSPSFPVPSSTPLSRSGHRAIVAHAPPARRDTHPRSHP